MTYLCQRNKPESLRNRVQQTTSARVHRHLSLYSDPQFQKRYQCISQREFIVESYVFLLIYALIKN